jgi:sigma-B regulation protein RsbU (phosphoserine phosphatase)
MPAGGRGELQALSTSARYRLAFVTDSVFGPYQSGLRKAFERAALQRGYDVLTVIGRGLGHADPAERAQNVMYEWLSSASIDGAVLLSSALVNFVGSAALEGLITRLGRVPKVSIGAKLPRASCISVDNRAGMRAAVDHLIEVHGCRRMGYLAGPTDNPEARARLEGYRYALEAHLLPFDQSLVEHSPFTSEGGAAAMQTLLERGRMFDAVVAANDGLAVGARQVLSSRGLSVPYRVRLIAFDDSPVAVSEQLSSVAQPFNQLALHALEALEAAMQGRLLGDVAFTPRLALRDSCGCGDANRRTELPALAKHQSAGEYLVAQRSSLPECLRELNAACFDWWSTRAERVLLGVEMALSGKERDFLSMLDELVAEAFEDGVPVEQIGRSLAQLHRHLRGATHDKSLDATFRRAQAQLTSALGRTEQKSRVEGTARSSALRDVTAGLWSVQNERELGQRIASELSRLGIKRAYLGLLTGSGNDRLQPCLQFDSSGTRLDGPSHPVRQLLPQGFLAAGAPSTWLVGVVNFGTQVNGIWACDGATDVLVFEQLRTEIGAVLQLLGLRRALALEPARVPVPRRVELAEASAHQEGGPASSRPVDDEEQTRVYLSEPWLEPAADGSRGPA